MRYPKRKPLHGGIKSTYPSFIEPALATTIDKVPSGERWNHEIKFDGYRVRVHLANNEIAVRTRRGNDWTKRFQESRMKKLDCFIANSDGRTGEQHEAVWWSLIKRRSKKDHRLPRSAAITPGFLPTLQAT
jgi:ATP-dependent DNA ligase